LNFTEIGVVPLFIWGWRFLGVLDDAGVFQRLAYKRYDCFVWMLNWGERVIRL
jgi:hypothetical protein